MAKSIPTGSRSAEEVFELRADMVSDIEGLLHGPELMHWLQAEAVFKRSLQLLDGFIRRNEDPDARQKLTRK